MKITCPQCKKSIVWSPEFPHRPFCSKRCQLIDLGQWADEEHRISDKSNADEIASQTPNLSAEDIENIEELLTKLSNDTHFKN